MSTDDSKLKKQIESLSMEEKVFICMAARERQEPGWIDRMAAQAEAMN